MTLKRVAFGHPCENNFPEKKKARDRRASLGHCVSDQL
jgi:hypothetical protein